MILVNYFWILDFDVYCLFDRKNIVFGKFVYGYDILKKIEDAGDEEGRFFVTVKIINFGEYSDSGKGVLSFLFLFFI